MGSRRSRVSRVRRSIDELTELGRSFRKLVLVTTTVIMALDGLTGAIDMLVHTLH